MTTEIPQGFIDEMRSLLGEQECQALCRALDEPATVAVRMNPARPIASPLPEGEPVEWHPQSRRLTDRPQFTLMPEFHAGAFYVQDPSSMFISHAVAHAATLLPGELTMLDACAAPGGKSTAAADALPEGSLLVANEYDARRAQILVENLTKWGLPNVIVTQGDTARLSAMRECFDLILVDAPCSGEGLMRKDETARSQWSQGLVRQCATLQQEILSNLWPTLRPGGILIYSTCTFNLAEDEMQVRFLMHEYGAESVEIPCPTEWGIGASRLPDLHALRFMPHLTRGEGLFLSMLRKPGNGQRITPRPSKKRKGGSGKASPSGRRELLRTPSAYEPVPIGEGEWSAIPKAYLPLYQQLASQTKVLQAGIPLVTEKGRDLIPHQALALSRELNPEHFPSCSLSREQALDYLRRQPLTLSPDAPRGYLLATYAGLPLGFLKNLGNRANNLYPAPWRIRNL